MSLSIINQDATALSASAVGTKIIGVGYGNPNNFQKRFIVFDTVDSTSSLWQMNLPHDTNFGTSDSGGGAVWVAASASPTTSTSNTTTLVAMYPDGTYDYWLPGVTMATSPVLAYCENHVVIIAAYGTPAIRTLNRTDGSWVSAAGGSAIAVSTPKYANGHVWWRTSNTVMYKYNPVTNIFSTITTGNMTNAGASSQTAVVVGNVYYWLATGGTAIYGFDTSSETATYYVACPPSVALDYSNGFFHLVSATGLHTLELATGAILSEAISGKGTPKSIVGVGRNGYTSFPTR